MRNCSLRVSFTLFLFVCSLGAHASGKGKDTCRVVTRVVSYEIPFEVKYEFNRLVGPGRVKKVSDGEVGEVRKTFQTYYEDGKPVGKVLASVDRIEPKPAVYAMGRNGYPTSRGSFTRHKVLVMEATAYDPSPATIGPGATGRTASGLKADFGMVAVDPRVIPLGTLLFVEGYGFALACDKGSAIKGNRIDLCYMSRSQALKFGRRSVRVHIFRSR